jgi:hypothetical protein
MHTVILLSARVGETVPVTPLGKRRPLVALEVVTRDTRPIQVIVVIDATPFAARLEMVNPKSFWSVAFLLMNHTVSATILEVTP